MMISRLFVLRIFTALAMLLMIQPQAAAQQELDRDATEARLEFLREEIERDRHLISRTAEAERTSEQTLEAVERQIRLREELTRTYRQRLRQLSFASDSLETTLTVLGADVGELKAEYQTRAAHAYKYGRMHDFALVLAAESINQMLIRVRYLSRFAQQRKRKLAGIQQAVTELEERRAELADTRAQTEQLLAEAELEERTLMQLQRDRREMIQSLRAQRVELEEGMRERLTEAEAIEHRMRDLFETESTRRRAVAAENPAIEEQYRQLSGSFMSNQGHLPWPARGVVVEPFGDRINPVHGTMTPNPGVFIATGPSDEIHAIFEGEVLVVDVMPGYGRLIVISHGDFKSLYSNFSLIYVSEGTRVEAGQLIGRAGTDAEPRGTGLFFSVFRHGEAIDPMAWLRPN